MLPLLNRDGSLIGSIDVLEGASIGDEVSAAATGVATPLAGHAALAASGNDGGDRTPDVVDGGGGGDQVSIATAAHKA